MTAVLGGEEAWMIPTLPLAKPHVASQKVRAIAVTSMKRVDELPDVATVAETLPGYEVLSWYGFAAPARTPAALVTRLNQATVQALAAPQVRKSLIAAGMTAESSTPAEFGKYIVAELDKWRRVVRDSNIQAE